MATRIEDIEVTAEQFEKLVKGQASINLPVGARSVSVSAIVHRADGTVEDHGVISYQHKSRIRMAAWRIASWFRRFRTPASKR